MGWLLLVVIVSLLGLAALTITLRRLEAARLSNRLTELERAKTTGTHRARLQYPHVDLSRCIGCGACVTACPEDGVLELIHGQAAVIHGARCVGHGRCAEACPVNAIQLTLGDLRERKDIPALNPQFEAPQVPGLFLAGEVTGFALIRTAITHGTAVADEVARRVQAEPRQASPRSDAYDLVVVGAGPAGLAASLQAKSHGLHFLTIEQETVGGTVSKYPRRKLVMTQPLTLPLHGRLKKTSYSKEELIDLWSSLAQEHQLPLRSGEQFTELTRDADGLFAIHTNQARYPARNVCLCLGRRGTPRKLGVPGEEMSKVAYSLIDAQSYQGRRILVVGGGDSAVEAAMGLAEQPGNEVTLSYRRAAFSRLKARNEARLLEAVERGRLRCLMESAVTEILPQSVRLRLSPNTAGAGQLEIPNDEVFVMAGGIPPFPLLEQCGVSFNPDDHPPQPPLAEHGAGLLPALYAALTCASLALLWTIFCRQYYALEALDRPLSQLHAWLRPSGAVGLSCGAAATALIVANLAYLLRRHRLGERLPGSLAAWMTSHIVTGVLAFVLVLVHAALAPRNTLGGHACAALGLLVVTGAIGRYFYACVPRAANGKELALQDLNSELAAESTQWDRFGRGFGDTARTEIHALVAAARWRGTFLHRLLALIKTHGNVQQVLKTLRERGQHEGLSPDQLDRLSSLAQRAYRTALVSAHYEDLRALLNSWRFFHRWIALLMVLLAVMHIFVALRYAGWWL